MGNTTHEVRLQQWYEIIQNQINSGQSKRNWCRENGISEKKFFYWQRRIRNEIRKTKEHALDLVKPGPPSTGFVEVPIAENTGNRLTEGFHPEAVISIGNITVGITGGISEDLLMSIGKMIRHAL